MLVFCSGGRPIFLVDVSDFFLFLFGRGKVEVPEKVARGVSFFSGPQQGPVERGHIKKRQKVSKLFPTLFDIFRAGQKKSKKCQKYFSTLFDNFRTAPVFRPLLGGSEFCLKVEGRGEGGGYPSWVVMCAKKATLIVDSCWLVRHFACLFNLLWSKPLLTRLRCARGMRIYQ